MNVKLLLPLLLATVATATPLLGKNHCTWGPSYWCKHVDAAKECNAMEHCSTVWKLNKPAESQLTGAKCSFCQVLVNDLKNFVAKQKTEAEITVLAQKGCNLIKSAEEKALCNLAVEKYLPEIISMINKKLNPSQICSAIGMCSGFSKKSAPFHAVQLHHVHLTYMKSLRKKIVSGSVTDNTTCDECLAFVGEIKNMITNNQTVNEIEALIEQEVCTQLGALKDECNQLVKQYIPIVFQMLAQELDPNTVCKMLGVCTAKGKANFAQAAKARQAFFRLVKARKTLKPKATPECTVCELIIGEARTLIRKNATQGEIEEFLKTRLCAHLGNWQAQCTAYVTEFAPMIFQLIASELEPEAVCQALGACGKSVHSKPIVKKEVKLRASPQCVLCEYVIQTLVKQVENNKTEAAIMAALEKVCSILPSTIKQECDTFVGQYGPVIIRLLESELSPQLICTTLGLCAGTSRPYPRAANANLHFKPATLHTDQAVCDVCQTTVSYVVGLLKEGDVEPDIEKTLEKVCNFLPVKDRSACDVLIKQFTPKLIQYLIVETNPRVVCQEIKLCAAAVPKK